MSGRPKETPTKFKTYKAYHESGRHDERLESLLKKQQKIEMLEAMIKEWEQLNPSDVKHIRGLYKRANQVREQLRVLSTTDPYEFASARSEYL